MWVFLAHMACERADGSLRLWGVACLALIAAMGALETVRHIEHAWPTLLRGDWTIEPIVRAANSEAAAMGKR
jgi:hypothetical protein